MIHTHLPETCLFPKRHQLFSRLRSQGSRAIDLVSEPHPNGPTTLTVKSASAAGLRRIIKNAIDMSLRARSPVLGVDGQAQYAEAKDVEEGYAGEAVDDYGAE